MEAGKEHRNTYFVTSSFLHGSQHPSPLDARKESGGDFLRLSLFAYAKNVPFVRIMRFMRKTFMRQGFEGICISLQMN